MRLVLVSKSGCPYCSLLKMELTKRGLPFEEVDGSDDTDRQIFYAAVQCNSVPQLFNVEDDKPFSLTSPHGKRLGGWTEVSADWNQFA